MRKFFSFTVLTAAVVLFVSSNILMANSLCTIKADGSDRSVLVTETAPVPQEKDLGIGPIKSVELGPLNKKMIQEGKVIYTNQCVMCHDIEQNKIGPALKNVTKTRTPQFIMNLLLNSAQMQKENVTVKALLKQYNNLPMPDPALNQAKARSVLEYLRSLVP